MPGLQDDPELNLRVQGFLRKTALLDRELTKLAVDIVTLQETRLAGSGSITEQHSTFFWTGRAEGAHRIHGVGFAVANKLLKDHLVDTPVRTSERIT